jgi:hypothetical protein
MTEEDWSCEMKTNAAMKNAAKMPVYQSMNKVLQWPGKAPIGTLKHVPSVLDECSRIMSNRKEDCSTLSSPSPANLE